MIRRLKLHPEVELIATSCRAEQPRRDSIVPRTWICRLGSPMGEKEDPDGMFLQLMLDAVSTPGVR